MPWLSHSHLLLSSCFCFQEHTSSAYFYHVQLLYKKDQWAQLFLLQVLTDVIFHTVYPSAESINKYCPTTKIFQCHQQNTANSYTVLIQRYICAALELISQKGSFSRKLKSLVSVKKVLSLLYCIHSCQCPPVVKKTCVGSLGVHSYVLSVFSCLLSEMTCCLVLGKLLHSAVSPLLHLQNEDNKNCIS